LENILPNDDVVNLRMGEVAGFDEPALIITRFDRTIDKQRIHFEEFNQLLNHPSSVIKPAIKQIA